MKKSIPVTLATIIITAALAFALNPSADQHRKKIKESVAESNQIKSLLGVGHLKAFASEYHSLGVASYTMVDDELTSVGVFGVVFVLE